jgi:16S rRNA (uracil1498-N3)-methyltransferase
MSAPRFYCNVPLSSGARVVLPENVSHHALRVLRLQTGAPIVLFNGLGGEYPAILHPESPTALAQLGLFNPREAELTGNITLVQGLPAGDKMDWIIEKAVELGATRIVPVAAQRSVLQLTGPRLEKRLLHWRRVRQAASEQCGRNKLMEIEAPTTLEQWLTRPTQALRLMGQPHAAENLADVLAANPATRHLTLLVGPEGGWSELEIRQACNHGVRAVHYGSRLLRTETAGIVLMSAACALLRWA